MAAKPNFNGRLQVNVGEALHKKVYRAAEQAGQSMTKFVAKLIKDSLAKKEQ